MSRSRRKTPGHCDRNPFMKSYYNRSIRRRNKQPVHTDMGTYIYIPSGRAFKKANCPYDICDWKWLCYTEMELREYLGKDYLVERYKYKMK